MSHSDDILPKKSASIVADESLQYVEDRRSGKIKSLRTKFKGLNYNLMGGWELNTITAIGAMSGSGKSTLAKVLCDSIIECNKDMAFNLYNFNFEMISHKNLTRSVVSSSGISMKEIYSVGEKLDDVKLNELKKHYNDLKARSNVFFIDVSGTPEKILKSLEYYYEKECYKTNKTLVYIIDHILLTEGKEDKAKIDELMRGLINLKKEIAQAGGNSVGFVLTQLNRNIKSEARMKYPDMQRPNAGDISDSLSN